MKSKMSKILTTFAVVLCMTICVFAIGVFATGSSTQSDELAIQSKWYSADDATSCINGETTYPTMDGYVFAGWYTESACAEGNGIASSEAVPTSGAYAKFVPTQVLTVKAQIANYLRDDDVLAVDEEGLVIDESAPIRFITSIDNKEYKEIGLKIEYTNASGAQTYTTTAASNKIVYKTLKAISNGLSTDLTPANTFCALSTYFRAHTLTGVPADYYDTTFKVTPFIITLDGTTVEAPYRTMTIEEGCIREEVWVSAAEGANTKDACYYGSQAYPYKTLNYALETMSNKATASMTESGTVTIHVASDLSVEYELDVKNPNGVDIVIDAANGTDGRYTVTAGTAGTGDATLNKNVFRVQSGHTGTATIKNMKLNHYYKGAAVQINTITDVNLDNMQINANDTSVTYLYGIINVVAAGTDATTKLNMTDVNMYLGGVAGSDKNQAIIRTGNAGSSNAKKVNINLVDCILDASGATSKKTICIMDTTEATVKAIGTTFKTNDQIPICDASPTSTVVKTRCSMDVTDSSWDSTVAYAKIVTTTTDEETDTVTTTVANNTYTTFAAAVTAANDSTKDVTIEMLNDVSLTSLTTFSDSTNKRAITIDGNMYDIAVGWSGGNHSINIGSATAGANSTTGVEFKNMTLEAHNRGSLIQVMASVPKNFKLSLTDVILEAKNSYADENVDKNAETVDMNYSYALIQLAGVGIDADLNMTRVDATMEATAIVGAENRDALAIVRTGNDNDTAKTVDITLSGTKLDTTGATGRCGIAIMKSTTATITLKEDTSEERNPEMDSKTIINTMNAQAIGDNSTAGATIIDEGYETNVTGREAGIGVWRLYDTFENALADANTFPSNTTIKLMKDVAIDGNLDIKNTSNKTITIDGASYTLTASKSDINHTFKINNGGGTGEVALKNITIDHQNYGSLLQVYSASGVTLTDTVIKATSPLDTTNGYQHTLINTLATGDTATTVTMTNVEVDMDTLLSSKDDNPAIIRTGNGNNKVDITLTNCELDTTGATNRSGIVVMSGSTATITTSGTTITTKNAYPIKVNNLTSGAVTVNGSNYTSSYDELHGTIAEEQEVDIDRKLYSTLANAVSSVKTATADKTLKLVKDITTTAKIDLLQEKSKNIIIDGQEHTITAKTSDDLFYVGGTSGDTVGNIVLKNMTINRPSGKYVLRNSTPTTIDMEDVTINGNGNHQYCLINLMAVDATDTTTLNLTDSTITLDTTASSVAELGIIRTGNNKESDTVTHAKNVKITLNNTKLYASADSGASGIRIMDTTKATVELKGNSEIKTKDTVPIYNKSTVATTSITDDGTTVFHATDVVAAVGNNTFTTVASAITDNTKGINAATTATALYLLQDCEITTAVTIKNAANQDVMIDGLGYTLTATSALQTEGDYVGRSTVNHSITINQTGTVTFENIELVHKNEGALIRVQALDTLKMEDVEITATAPVNTIHGYRFALINTELAKNATTTLDFTRVNVDMDATLSPADNNAAFIRTGNAYNSETDPGYKTVKITLDGCYINTSGATKRGGIQIMDTTKATVTLKNGTEIHTAADAYAIKRNIDATYTGDTIKQATSVICDSDCVLTAGTNTGSDAVYGVDGIYGGIQLPSTTYRVVLFADTHYTVEEAEKATLNPASYAAGTVLGYTQAQKIAAIKSDISAFTAANAVDALLVLGDLSLDDCGHRSLSTNYVSKFKTEVMDVLATGTKTGQAYAIAGNHDSYSSSEWNDIFGYNRDYSFTIGNAAFIMMDTYKDESKSATGAAGSAYVGVDTDWLKTEIAKYPDAKQIFLCAHYLHNSTTASTDEGGATYAYTDAFKAILNSDSRIKCMFDAHIHVNKVQSVTGVTQKQVTVGAYAYKSYQDPDTLAWDFSTYDENYAWGYQVLEWNDDGSFRTYHVKNARSYTSSDNVVNSYPGASFMKVLTKLK